MTKNILLGHFSSVIVHNTNMNNINMIKVKEPAQ